jgi:hypothetical protein
MRGCGGAHYSVNGGGEALDRLNALLSQFQRYTPPSGAAPSGCGALSSSCQISAAGGNLVIQLAVPMAGPFDPLILFTYSNAISHDR